MFVPFIFFYIQSEADFSFNLEIFFLIYKRRKNYHLELCGVLFMMLSSSGLSSHGSFSVSIYLTPPLLLVAPFLRLFFSFPRTAMLMQAIYPNPCRQHNAPRGQTASTTSAGLNINDTSHSSHERWSWTPVCITLTSNQLSSVNVSLQ